MNKSFPNKYRNIKTVIDNVGFSSKAEARRYQELKLLLKAKKIHSLELQPRFPLQPAFTDEMGNRHKKIEYVADFIYNEKGQVIVEDVKGIKTEVYRLKKKLFLHKHRGIIFRES